MKHRGKVVIGYPVGGSVTLAFHASMLRLLGHELCKGDSRLLAKINHAQGLYVADNRGTLIEHFLKTGAEWLLQIDTDIEFPQTIIETLLDIAGPDKKIVAASVPLGTAFPTCAFMRTDRPGVWDPVPRIGGVIECDGIATAVVLINRQVFYDIADISGQCWMHHMYLPKSGASVPAREFQFLSQGEDLAFSARATTAGHKIYCAYIPGLKHHKTQALSHDGEYQTAYSTDPGVGELVAEETA